MPCVLLNLFRFLLTILPPYVWAHHNLILMIMESANEKTLFEVSEIQLSLQVKGTRLVMDRRIGKVPLRFPLFSY